MKLRTSAGMCVVCVRVCAGARVHAGVYGCVRRGLRGSPGVCWGVPGYMQVCAGVRGKAGVCPF